jgi:magnesium transporter
MVGFMESAKTKQPATQIWPKDSAGRRMTSAVPTATLSEALKDVLQRITKQSEDLASIDYIYVLDDEKKLAGVLSIRDLYRHDHETRVGNICKKDDIKTVRPTTDQEHVAYMALKHDLKSIPVTDHEHVFLGAIPNDVVMHILHHELQEDMLRFAGVHHGHSALDNVLTLPLRLSVLHRLPWLIIGLLGGFLTAAVIRSFEDILSKNLILAAFIPLIVYMSSAVGNQVQTFAVRDVALNSKLPMGTYILRQFLVILIISVLCGLLLFVLGYVQHQDLRLALVLGISLLVAINLSIFTGLCIPLMFDRFNMDPANASGPISTIIQDLLSILVYFSTASILLG